MIPFVIQNNPLCGFRSDSTNDYCCLPTVLLKAVSDICTAFRPALDPVCLSHVRGLHGRMPLQLGLLVQLACCFLNLHTAGSWQMLLREVGGWKFLFPVAAAQLFRDENIPPEVFTVVQLNRSLDGMLPSLLNVMFSRSIMIPTLLRVSLQDMGDKVAEEQFPDNAKSSETNLEILIFNPMGHGRPQVSGG